MLTMWACSSQWCPSGAVQAGAMPDTRAPAANAVSVRRELRACESDRFISVGSSRTVASGSSTTTRTTPIDKQTLSA